MLIDRKLQFFDGDVTEASDVVKFYTEGEFKLSANRHGAGYWNLQANTELTGTGSIKLKHSADGEAWADVPGMEIKVATSLEKGKAFSLRLPFGTKQFLKVEATGITGKVCSYLGDPIAEH